MKVWPKPAKDAIRALALTAAFGVAVTVGAVFTRDANGVGTLGMAAAFLAAALLLLDLRWGIAVGLASFAVNVAAFLAVGDSPAAALTFSAVNVTEASLLAWLAHMTLGSRVRRLTPSRLARLLLFAAAPATAVSALLAASASVLLGRSFDAVLGAWFYMSAVGAVIVTPAVLLMFQREDGQKAGAWEQVAILCAMVGFAVFATHFNWFPIYLALFFILTIVAFRMGARGVGVAVLLVTAVEVAGVILHPESGLNPAWTVPERIRRLNFVVALASMTAVATAMALAAERRQHQLWLGRSRIARRAESRARNASRARDEFLASMGHEIRTPMNSIMGFADLLSRQSELPETAKRQVELIMRAGDSLVATIDEILDYSRLAESGVKLEPKAHCLGDLARDVMALVSGAAKEKRLALDLTLAGETDRRVMVDEPRVRQALLSLMGNAVKFTDAGRVRLDVHYDAETGRARFTVTDTGVGIPDEKIASLFEPFSRLDCSTTRTTAGSGLGLATAKLLVEAMGGVIRAEAGIAEGAIFWFEIPLSPAPDEVGPREEPQNLGARVLLVDDHPANRELGKAVLEVLGCEVVLAADGESALAAVRTGLFDVILMDVHMPRMDGLEATRLIRRMGGEARRTPIVAMSADVAPEMTKRCLQVGMVDALGKPIQIAGVQAILMKWVGRSADDEARAA